MSAAAASVRWMHDAFLDAADSAIALLARAEVAEQWTTPSALAEWSVGGLAAHLASQLPTALSVLAHPVGDQQPIALHEHYARAAWVDAAVDDTVNVAIQSSTDDLAALGSVAVVDRTRSAWGELAAALANQPLDRMVVIPWQGWALTLHDFLVTRMMEIAVHSDDLATSVGIDAPELPPSVLQPVVSLLTDLAVRRHGQAALIRALARRERAPLSIAAF